MTRLRRIAANLALVLISTIATVALLEGGARFLKAPASLFIYPSPHNCMRRDPQLSLAWLKNCSGSMADTVFRTNAAALRGAELRNDGAVRILAIGDSNTWGWGVADAEAYPAALQDILDRRFGANRYEVLNAGMPGYTSYQGLLYLREHGLRFKPSIVLAGFGFNDATPDGDITTRIEKERDSLPFLRLDDFLLYQSYFWRWARSRWQVKHEVERLPRVDVPRYADNLTGILDVARENRAEAMLVDFLGPHGTAKTYSNAMQRVSEERDTPMLVYRGPRIDVVHPTREGYRFLAAQIVDRLVAAGYIANPSGSRS
jgi:lysophospholipase L1-like esterase